MYRQGDVLIKKLSEEITEELEEIKRDEQGRIVLAYGEATGHAHAIKAKEATLMRGKNTNNVYLLIEQPVDLLHEEHHKIKLPAGNYHVIRQREYSPKEVRYVQD